ncbi:oxygen-independent coproporphyrinogen III oxidase [Sphingobium sp. H39-3-25]|uniref:oxygen-independent coproporphyrinogen III oxidase n=1 Tax=Sphingobium arseniciresistens TaxID=3030834 RepID=UPI0023B9E57F|nr:oxygen-independent coproporphyrinogen III oxidase [Sphingobium arseniciresistens]
MRDYHPDLLEASVPRYTSYPTAAQFSGDVGAPALAERLGGVAADADLSLYLHIPYCHDICWYCGCNTGAAGRASRLSAYVEALEREIALVAGTLGGRGIVRHVAFGGGSPNALPLVDFVRIFQQLTLCFAMSEADISVEIDPRRFDRQWIAAMGSLGVRRVNLGVQTFAPHVQQRIGRVQPREMVEAVVAGLRAEGIAVGFDLMYGLPGQSLADLEETLEATIALRPARIALFGYAHMPRLLPRQRRINGDELPASPQRFDMAALGYDRLTAAGYRAIGFDHFALPEDSLAIAAEGGTLRRNFQGFTDDASNHLIGLGASAISMFPDLIVQNEKNAGAWRALVSSGALSAVRGVVRTPADRMRGRIIEDILCRGHAEIADVAVSGLDRFTGRGLAERSGQAVRLSPGGLPYARAVASAFDAYLQPAEKRFSNAI